MAEAAEKQDYELAAVYRDRLRALTYIQGSQTVHAEGLWATATSSRSPARPGRCASRRSFIRGGQNWGHRSFFPAHTNDVPEEEVLSSFLMQFMRKSRRQADPDDRDLKEGGLIGEALCERAATRSRFRSRSAAPGARLIEQARRNAEEALDRRMAETTTQGKLLRELAEVFELPEPPKRIEVYDNSHIMGTNATGAMIVAGPRVSAKTPTASSTSSRGSRRVTISA